MKNTHTPTKILINNVVPLNNGDVALFTSLYKSLIKEGFSVKIATYYYHQAKELYPDLPFVSELGDYKIFIKLPFLKPFFLPFFFIFSKAYTSANIIIGAPGGYINSNYKIRNSLSVFKYAKFFDKKTFIYAQSVGPLNKRDGRFLKKLITKSIDFIYVRDTYSFNVVEKLGVQKDKFKLTNDAAFLLENDSTANPSSNKVAFSVRNWKYDNRNIGQFENMITTLVILAVDNGFSVDFLSTCQGLENYKNDAQVAQSIYDKLPTPYKNKVSVLNNYFSFDDFYAKLGDYDFVVGTRLHMCITALTKMIPAFNISYEVKGKECYDYMGLSEYSIDYNENSDTAVHVFGNFIKNQKAIKQILSYKIPENNQKAKDDFKYFVEKLK